VHRNAREAIVKLRDTSEIANITNGKMNARDFRRRARLGEFPPGVVIRLNRRILVDEDALVAFLASGGTGREGAGQRVGRGGDEAHPAV